MRPRILHFPQHCQTVHYWHSQRFPQPPITSLDTIPQKIIHYQSWHYLLKQALPIFSNFNVTIHNQLWDDINSPNHPLPVLSCHGSLQPSITSLELTYIPTTIQYQSWHHFLKPSTTTNLDIISYNHSLPFWHHGIISYKQPLGALAPFPTNTLCLSWPHFLQPSITSLDTTLIPLATHYHYWDHSCNHPSLVLTWFPATILCKSWHHFLQSSTTSLNTIPNNHPLPVLTSFPTTIYYKL